MRCRPYSQGIEQIVHGLLSRASLRDVGRGEEETSGEVGDCKRRNSVPRERGQRVNVILFCMLHDVRPKTTHPPKDGEHPKACCILVWS